MAESDRNQTDGTLDPIEAEVERDRADLVGTVEALRTRLFSSGTVRSQVGRYVGQRRQGAMSGVQQRMRDHPLETVALAAGAAYPIVRVVSKIPAPILLLGAGVAMAGRGGSKGGSHGGGRDGRARGDHRRERRALAPAARLGGLGRRLGRDRGPNPTSGSRAAGRDGWLGRRGRGAGRRRGGGGRDPPPPGRGGGASAC